MKKNYFKSLMQAAVLVCTPLVIASCDDVFGDTDNPIPAYMSIKQSDINLVLHADKKDQATATRTAIAATGAEVVYESTKPEVATVDAKTGVITAVGEGTCEIIAKVTGKDSNGRDTYQPQQASFSVSVKDYRCRVNLIEGVEIPAFNVADKDLAEIDLTKIVEAWPKNVTLTYTSDKPAIADMVDGKLKLIGGTGTAKVKAEIKAADVPENYEAKSFPKNQVTKEFEITVKDGVAYVAGYDAENKEIRKTMFKDFNGEKYIDLSDKLMNEAKTAFVNSDVILDAGWYYVDRNLSSFAHNIRVKGDVNIILNDDYNLNLGSHDLMDESAKQNYKLNFYPQKKTVAGWGYAEFNSIKEFKEVNICGVYVNAPVNAVENVNIINGGTGNLTGIKTGAVDITNGSAGQLSKFATVTINKGTSASSVSGMDNIETATISEGATVWNAISKITTLSIGKGASVSSLTNVKTVAIDQAASVGNMTGITDLTINKATTIGTLNKIGTAVITETPTKSLQNITTLTLNKVNPSATSQLRYIGTVTINKLTAAANFSSITANVLNISDGTIVSGKIEGFVKDAEGNFTVGKNTKVAMTGGKLTVNGPTGDVYAVLGDVEVTKGEFTALSQDYHAVSGALVGTFYGGVDEDHLTKITGEERPKYITTIEPKK